MAPKWYADLTEPWRSEPLSVLQHNSRIHCTCNCLPFSPPSLAITQPGSRSCQRRPRDIKNSTRAQRYVDTDTRCRAITLCTRVGSDITPPVVLCITPVLRIRSSPEHGVKFPRDWHTLTFPAKPKGCARQRRTTDGVIQICSDSIWLV